MNTASVALVEDELGMRERIARVIGAAPELQLVMAAASGQEILGFLADSVIDVLLVDLGLPDMSGLEVIRQCRRMQPACAVMVMTIFGDESNMVRAFEAGASGYLLKDGTEADLAVHIRNLHAGGSPLSPVIARQLLSNWKVGGLERGAPPAAPAAAAAPRSERIAEKLSAREFEVLNLVARGFTYSEIGERIGIATSTVQTYIKNIYGKLDVHNKSEAVFEARSMGWLP
jgi:DNA-binding NarL/FixJ family response regulator